MQRTLPVVITPTLVGNPTPGAWCSRCLLPSGVTATFLFELDGRPWTVTELGWCTDCGTVL